MIFSQKKCSTERLDAQPTMGYSSASYRGLADGSTASSTLSLFSVSAYANERDAMIVNEVDRKKSKKRFHGLASVKNATKCAAKKINRILVKAKSKLIKPTAADKQQLANISITSSSTHFTDVDLYDDDDHDVDDGDEEEEIDEFQELNFNNISSLSTHYTLETDHSVYRPSHCEQQYRPNDSIESTAPDSSFQSDVSLNESSLIHQIFAESMADLDLICAANEKAITKRDATKKIVRKGTPYKLKMPHRLTVYDERYDSLVENREIHQSEMIFSNENQWFDALNSTYSNNNNNNSVSIEKEAALQSKFDLKLHFGRNTPIKESFLKRIAQKCRQIEQILSQPKFLYSF